MSVTPPSLADVIVQKIASRTSQRVRNLAVELGDGLVVLRGRVSSFHVKQLAQAGAREVLPGILLENAIVVE